MEITVRHAEPDDAEAIHRILSGARATAGTLQLPLQSLEGVRKRFSETPEGLYHLVACVEDEVVGHLGLETFTRPRRRHVGEIGMAVRDDWQGRGVGTALMQAALDLADKWQRRWRRSLQKVRLRDRRHPPPLRLQGRRVRGRLLDGPPEVAQLRRSAIGGGAERLELAKI
jgi:putative acetyltransferase